MLDFGEKTKKSDSGFLFFIPKSKWQLEISQLSPM